MKHTILVILGCLLAGSLFSLGIGFYSKDLLLDAIGGLLAVALILLFLEFKKTDSNPFL